MIAGLAACAAAAGCSGLEGAWRLIQHLQHALHSSAVNMVMSLCVVPVSQCLGVRHRLWDAILPEHQDQLRHQQFEPAHEKPHSISNIQAPTGAP